MDRDSGFLVLTPAGWPDPALAIAAARAGALGVLNLEFTTSAEAVQAALAALARHGPGPYGVLVDGDDETGLDLILGRAPASLTTVLLTPTAPARLPELVRRVRARGCQVFLVVTDQAEADLGEEVGVDALVAKGHEAGGWVGEETTFVLLQRLRRTARRPVWAYGGIGQHTVGAAGVAGAAGVVLDSQLLLTRESPLPASLKERLSGLDGSETVCLGEGLGARFRGYAAPATGLWETLRAEETALRLGAGALADRRQAWRQAVRSRVDWRSPDACLLAVGQDVALAAPLARRFPTVGRLLQGLRAALREHVRVARDLSPWQAGAPLARAHGTRYPLVQGPMTRVSDRADFAAAVAANGALPFLALALMRQEEVRALLAETRARLGSRPWGVGILGFVPPDLRAEQLAAIQEACPPFALIAGGRPDQARQLEQAGIATYLHVPSPGLLRLFLAEGARRFVFEGRECGGHVGPRTSFVLWELMVAELEEHLAAHGPAGDYHVLFAGGIHEGLSAAMVAAVAAPLAERGVRVGLLMGTAYLFTEEAVQTGAIVPGFQQAALAAQGTVLLESGAGHLTRCLPSPYVDQFEQEKLRLLRAGATAEVVRQRLEELNVGRLRIAAKGVDRHPRFGQDQAVPKLVAVDPAEQWQRGLFMIGQVAALRDRVCSLADLHREVAEGSTAWLKALPWSASAEPAPPPAAVAIVGMACLLPGALDLAAFWANVMNKVDAITEVPPERWDWRLYYDPDPAARDRIVARWGGFLPPVPFDPVAFGMPPSTLASIEPFQLLTLLVVRAALADAGYLDGPLARERTAVILGAGGGAGDLSAGYITRSLLPTLFGEQAEAVLERLADHLPEWTEDSFAGLLMNVAAGRVANRFDFGGLNFTVDAACASSLAAVYLGVRELETGTSDMVIVGGVDTLQNPFAFLCFSKTRALSPSGRCRPFDAQADGIAISEGLVALVLKRLADAERDGDRIYAVIRGVGGSSDGRDRSLTAPRPAGQLRAFRRAYAQAGFSPATVGLFEAHGTGTVAGDQAEIESLTTLLAEAGARPQSVAIGSVKSLIGHTKATAGAAGLAKVALALAHRVLPPTLAAQPHPQLTAPTSPLFLNTEARPWLSTEDTPRRAGVSAFGFGGTNFHVVLEEYTGAYFEEQTVDLMPRSAELFLWRGESPAALIAQLEPLLAALERGARPRLADLASAVDRRATSGGPATLAIVARSLDDLREKLQAARALLAQAPERHHDARGVHFSAAPLAAAGQVAYLFPGQGSQYVGMAREIALLFPEARASFEEADRVLAGAFDQPLSRFIFPPPAFTPAEEQRQQAALTATRVAQPALGATAVALFRVLQACGMSPQMVAGHSYGEFVALWAAGCFDTATLLGLSETRGRYLQEETTAEAGTMAAVEAGPEELAPLLADLGVVLANLNAPRQTVISGSRAAVEEALARCAAQGLRAQRLPVACAFHSPLVAPAQRRLAARLSETPIAAPRLPVFANADAAPYPEDPTVVAARLAEHLVRPVRFVEQIRAMFAAGARIFVEVGPRAVLTGLVGRILDGEPHLAVAVDQPGRSGLEQLLNALAALAAEGVAIRTDRLFARRPIQPLDPAALHREEPPTGSATVWLVDGGCAWSAAGARPRPQPLRGVLPERVARPDPPAPVPPADGRAEAPAPGAAPVPAGPLASVGPATVAPLPEGRATVMVQFQELMRQFLATQQRVMLAYLGAAPPASPPEAAPPAPVATRVVDQAPPLVEASGSAPERPGAPGAMDGIRPTTDLPPAVPAEATGTASRAPGAVVDPAALLERVRAVVAERTGYPPEMLGPEADLEADLGIDSIKRVEIVGLLARRLARPDRPPADLEALSRSRTLRQLVERLSAWLGDGGETEGSTAVEAARPFESRPSDPALGRFLVGVYPLPPVEAGAGLAVSGWVVVVDEGGGVGVRVAQRLRQRGCRVVRVGVEGSVDSELVADLGQPEAVARLIEDLHQRCGPVAALVFLAALRPGAPAGFAPERWRERLAVDLRGLFQLLQGLAPDLQRAASEGGAAVLAATAMGGTFGVEASGSFFAGHGGLVGFLKTLAQEWPAVRVKAVDLGPADPDQQAAWLVDELLAADGVVEVGYADGRRTTLALVPAPLADRPDDLRLDERSVVLITGGARGITAEVAVALAERYRPTLLLVGRTPLPAAEEGPETAGLSDPVALRRALLVRRQRAGEPVVPALIEADYQRLLREREVRRNLSRLRATGAQVHYHVGDVREAAAFGRLLTELSERYGRIDGVIHGAGVIEDRLVVDKTLDSFERVIATKVESALVLATHLRPETVRFLVFFGSFSGRFGNRGQSDYAAACEILSKLAWVLDRRWPGRVVAIDWGPWTGVGMVSPTVERQFRARGVALIRPAEGGRWLLAEVQGGRKREAEVVIGGLGGWAPVAADQPAPTVVARPDLPLLTGRAVVRSRAPAAVEIQLRLDPATDRYLHDHRLDGRPVLPFTMALALLVEAAAAGWPDQHPTEVRQLERLQGIVLEAGPLALRLVGRQREEAAGRRVVAMSLETGDRPAYRAEIMLEATPVTDLGPVVPPVEPPAEAVPVADDLGTVYRQWLFHGPLFQRLSAVPRLGPQGGEVRVTTSQPAECLTGGRGHWLLDPLALDAVLQGHLLWARCRWGLTSLPARLQRIRWLSAGAPWQQAGGPWPLRAVFRLTPESAPPISRADHILQGPDGRVVAVLEGVELVGSPALNRLAGALDQGGGVE